MGEVAQFLTRRGCGRGHQSAPPQNPSGVGRMLITISLSPPPHTWTVYTPLTSSILRPVADVVLGRVVVPAIYLPKPRTVKVHRDGWRSGRVTHPVNAPLVRQHARDPIFTSPLEPPELVQAGIVSQGAIVGTLVALFKYGSQDATEGSPGGMVVDLGRGTRRPDENLQRVGMVGIVLAIGHIPALGPSCYLQEGQDMRIQKPGISYQARQYGGGLPQGHLRSGNVEVGCTWRGRHLGPFARVRVYPNDT